MTDKIPSIASLAPALSGRYSTEGVDIQMARMPRLSAVDPLHDLPEPIYLANDIDSVDAGTAGRVGLTLFVDIDGGSPLAIVSGNVSFGGAEPDHFVGRIVDDRMDGALRVLRVEGFILRWAPAGTNVERLDLTLDTAATPPRAEAVFTKISGVLRSEPQQLERVSPWFREVEIEIDCEDGALDIEPYPTHLHPDRPDDLADQELTIEVAYAQAGILLQRTDTPREVVGSVEAGDGAQWSYSELHDSMHLHWQSFANQPQWKMWLFLAGKAERSRLGGVMFDGRIREPGGVDRQGTAIFTRCEYFHSEAGGYPEMNPPAAEAARRELFFNMVHEVGHTFNLAHPFERTAGTAWKGPDWAPRKRDDQALTWMNYPNLASPELSGANASWFYSRFRFCFDPQDLMFLRHAPEKFVEMGSEAWFENHGRVAVATVDRRLRLTIKPTRKIIELGEPVLVELRLHNEWDRPIPIHDNLDPADGLVEFAVTTPDGRRIPVVPMDQTRNPVVSMRLAPGATIYESIDLTMGAMGFPFKQPGAYRIEASYTNIDGSTAAAVAQLYLRPPASYDDTPVINEVFNAKVGSVLYVDGTRVLDDVLDKMDWIRKNLGPAHPLVAHLTVVRYRSFAGEGKLRIPGSEETKVLGAEPDMIVQHLAPMLGEHLNRSVTTFGNMYLGDVAETVTRAAEQSGALRVARTVQEDMLGLFRARGVIASVVEKIAVRVEELRSRTTDSRKQ